MYLVWMECQTAGCTDSLSQESLVVLDGTQVVPRRVVYTDKLVRGTTATTDNMLVKNFIRNTVHEYPVIRFLLIYIKHE